MADNEPQAKPSDGNTGQLTWKDLADFAGKQAENTRSVIDYWFKLAAQLLGFVLASSGEFVGSGERQRAVLVRNWWNLRHVESKDLS
jgi:hypothetical protein